MSFAGNNSNCSDSGQHVEQQQQAGGEYLEEDQQEQKEVTEPEVEVADDVREQSERLHDPSPLTKSVALYEVSATCFFLHQADTRSSWLFCVL